jgi:hypothetical protein
MRVKVGGTGKEEIDGGSTEHVNLVRIERRQQRNVRWKGREKQSSNKISGHTRYSEDREGAATEVERL